MMIQRGNKRKKIEEQSLSFSCYVWIFTILSFFGWCFEKVGRYLLYPADPIRDRGFLSLPLCTIYGTCLVLIGFLLGSPNEPSRWMKRLLQKGEGLPKGLQWIFRMLGYFIAAVLLSTAVELFTGILFWNLGIPLWNYSERWGNLWGVICPQYSILWGFLITLLMSVIWRPLCRWIMRVPQRTRRIVAALMIVLMLGDFLFNCGYVIVTGKRFYFL